MNHKWTGSALTWITRIVSILFVAMNAWGWWDESQARQDPSYTGAGAGDPIWAWAVVAHLLPLLLIFVATIIGWRMPIYGLLGFGLFTLLQALSVGTEWVYLPCVVLPPLAITVMYLFGWMFARRQRRS